MLENAPEQWNEADVETQIVLPLLTREELLAFPKASVKSKEYLSSKTIGKGSRSKVAYIPDFTVYIKSIPVAVIESKRPTADLSVAYSEACLYALELNKIFPEDINPCTRVLATNGIRIQAGSWESAPLVDCEISDLWFGSDSLEKLIKLMGHQACSGLSEKVIGQLEIGNFKRPFNRGGGDAMLVSKVQQNTFAADLAPILRRYFSSRDQNKDPEIFQNAYISTNEITSYDRILESFLKDRLSKSRDRVAIETSKKRASRVTTRLSEFDRTRPTSGDLQLVTGGVGAGKSLFARRYKEFLQPAELAERNHWAFLDFNSAPDDLSSASDWVYQTFVESIISEGAPVSPIEADDQERIFAVKLKERQAYYNRMEAIRLGNGELEKARDIEMWRQDPTTLAAGISRYLQGDRGENVVVVFDNVDRRESSTQLAAFQTALWFMNETRSLVILQMRDSTFELFKDQPPLDTYRTGVIFHIQPPRFVDVVSKRLELSLATLAKEAPEIIKYKTPNGIEISYPKSRAGHFLRAIYSVLFERKSNVSIILEALAGRNVRRALDMFMAIITSGHMPEDLITSVATGGDKYKFPEHKVLKILMRQDYKFFNDSAGFVANIFYCDADWARKNNFTVVEVLFFLIGRRKSTGDNGLMGYLSLASVQERLEMLGYHASDVKAATAYCLKKGLIEADNASDQILNSDTCVKATASGWAHLRLLSGRLEYLGGILHTTPLSDERFAARVFDRMQIENRHGGLGFNQTLNLVQQFEGYLEQQYRTLSKHPGYISMEKTGARYVLGKVADAIAFSKRELESEVQLDWLDR